MIIAIIPCCFLPTFYATTKIHKNQGHPSIIKVPPQGPLKYPWLCWKKHAGRGPSATSSRVWRLDGFFVGDDGMG